MPGMPYNIIAVCHDARHDARFTASYVIVLLQFLPVYHRYVQRIVRTTSPQSYEYWRHGVKITDNFCYTRSAILEAIDVLPCINTSAVVKKGNRTQRKTKVSP